MHAQRIRSQYIVLEKLFKKAACHIFAQVLFDIPQIRQVISPRHRLGQDLYSIWISQFIRESTSLANGAYILDVGGSDGDFMSKICDSLKSRCVLPINVDLNLSYLKQSRRRHSGLECIRADASSLPFKDCSIDIVYSISVLEHIKEMERAVSEQCRVAGEAILFQIPNIKYFIELHTFMPMLGIMPHGVRERIWIRGTRNAPINWNATFKKLATLFKNNGFRLQSVKKLYHLRILACLALPVGYLSAFKRHCGDGAKRHQSIGQYLNARSQNPKTNT